MPKRVKPNLSPAAFPVHSLEDVDAALAQIAARKRQIDLIGLGVAEQVDEIKTRAAAETEPIRLEIAALELAIGRFAEANKAELFSKKKSVQLQFGIVGFRASSKLKTLKKWTFERVLATLRDTGMWEYIRVKEEVDKKSSRASRRKPSRASAAPSCRRTSFTTNFPNSPNPKPNLQPYKDEHHDQDRTHQEEVAGKRIRSS